MKVVLHLTESCNLRCTYCYAPAKTKSSMTVETAKGAIDMALDHAGQSACVSYFGGEPLLKLDVIKQLTAFARQQGEERGIDMHFRMATNGTLFNEESLTFCRDNNILFAISLDGDQKAHDAQRLLANGRGSFQLIDSKLDMILAYNPYTVVTSVVTPATVERLASSIEYLWRRGVRYVVHALDYTHADWTPEVFDQLERSYNELADFFLARARAEEHFHFSLFDDKLKTHASSPIVLGELCDFGARKISVAPDGRIFPCVQFISDRPDANDYCIGDVEAGLNEGRRHTLVQANKSERPQCSGCALLGRCANYCGCINWNTTGRVNEVPGILCAHERMLIPIADRIGNVLWNEKNGRFLRKHYKSYDQQFVYSMD